MNASPGRQVSSYLMAAAARFSIDDARRIAKDQFGLEGGASLLSGERDENFLVESGKGAFVLKIAHPSEDPCQIAFHTRALLHVADRAPALPVPHVLPARNGRHEVEVVDGQGFLRVARILTFLPGTMAARLPIIGSGLRRAIGATLARMDAALEDFSDPADTFELSWDVTQCSALRPLISAVAEASDRSLAERAFDAFEHDVMPAYTGLRRQVIHNDLTPFNVLVGEDHDAVAGIIDFGDMIRAPRINDLAIACAYHIGAAGDALAPVLDIVSAYNAVARVPREECDLMPAIIAARLAITVVITEWHAARNSENRAYILKNHPTAVRGLNRLFAIPQDEARARFRAACGWDG